VLRGFARAPLAAVLEDRHRVPPVVASGLGLDDRQERAAVHLLENGPDVPRHERVAMDHGIELMPVDRAGFVPLGRVDHRTEDRGVLLRLVFGDLRALVGLLPFSPGDRGMARW